MIHTTKNLVGLETTRLRQWGDGWTMPESVKPILPRDGRIRLSDAETAGNLPSCTSRLLRCAEAEMFAAVSDMLREYSVPSTVRPLGCSGKQGNTRSSLIHQSLY